MLDKLRQRFLVTDVEPQCIPRARQYFKSRIGEGDTGVVIVRMLSGNGTFLGHWYCRSREYVANDTEWTNVDGQWDIPAYVGPAEGAPEEYYGETMYMVDEELTESARRINGVS